MDISENETRLLLRSQLGDRQALESLLGTTLPWLEPYLRKIANREYRQLTKIGWDTAHRELQALVAGGVFTTAGRGRSTAYRLNLG